MLYIYLSVVHNLKMDYLHGRYNSHTLIQPWGYFFLASRNSFARKDYSIYTSRLLCYCDLGCNYNFKAYLYPNYQLIKNTEGISGERINLFEE